MGRAALLLVAALSTACGPRAAIPTVPATLPGAVAFGAPAGQLALALAPVLYLHPNETFQLARAVAVVHPDSQIVAYHLLWRDDAHGAWIPGTVPTDQEIVWVGHDSTGAPTRLWTYWHGTILTTPVALEQVAVDVQWGKHGSLPRNILRRDLPRHQSLGVFYAFTWALPDYWLGRLQRDGPLCFCRGFATYREFTEPELLAPQISVVVETEAPRPALGAVFGARFSQKPDWPWDVAR